MPLQLPCETDFCENMPTYEYRAYDECGEFICTKSLCGPCADALEEAGKDIRAVASS
jgi:hypothetical protein